MVNGKNDEGPAVEIAYERESIKYPGLEIELGYLRGNKAYRYNHLVFAGDRANVDVTISNTHLSLSLKPHVPIENYFQLDGGIGAGLYYNMESEYLEPTCPGRSSENKEGGK